MSTNYDRLPRAQLVAELKRRDKEAADEINLLQHNMEVYREELLAQHRQLQETHLLLEASRDAYAELYDFAPIAYLSIDTNGIIQSINLTGCSLLERERSRLIGLPLYSFFIEQDKAQFLDHLRRCRRGEAIVETELTLRTRLGNAIQCLVSSRPNAGPPTFFRTIITDITERCLAESALRELNATLERRVAERTAQFEQANQELTREIAQRQAVEEVLVETDRRKDQFLAMLGHELRNPLASIRSAADLLTMLSPGDLNFRESIDVIRRQSLQMTRIIDDLLDVTRIAQGKIALRIERLDLGKITAAAVADVQRRIEREDLRLECQLPATPVWIDGDRTRLAQIVGNLLDNSIKFTPSQGQIRVTLAPNAEQSTAQLVVEDTGIGIDPSMLSAVFDSFIQGDADLDRRRGGLGLGLAVVKGLVQLQGGKVHAASEGRGKGTRIVIEFPTTQNPDLAQNSQSTIPKTSAHSILLIDDNRDALVMLKAILEQLGQAVSIATDAETGLEVARSTRPEAIISDIGLPQMDGYTPARKIRAEAGLQQTVLVALSGYGQPQDQQRAIDAGFDEHITKPVALDRLEALIARLDQHASSRPNAMHAHQ